MGYGDIAKRALVDATVTRPVHTPRIGRKYYYRREKSELSEINPGSQRRTGNELNELHEISLPVLEPGPGNPALRKRLLMLGAEFDYPALEVGRYRFRDRVVTVGLTAGRGWWEHETNFFGNSLLNEAIRRVGERQ